MTKPTATFLWLDLETSGLDPEVDAVLECAYVITDANLVELARGERVFRFDAERFASECAEVVQKMHTANGLFAEAQNTSEYAINALAGFLLSAVEPFAWDGMEPADKTDAKRLPILAGSTIRFDHSFMRDAAPEFANDDVLHHRQLDVTASMLLAKTVGATFAKAEAHRAMADVLESLENARTCRKIIADGVDPLHAVARMAQGSAALTEMDLDTLCGIFAKLRA